MDVQRGHCWRCEVPLEQTIRCPDCKMAKYCSSECEHGDRVRHRSRECPLFGTRSCSKCSKKGSMKQCAGCNFAWYCNQDCQKSDWANHKESCNKTKVKISTAADTLKCKYEFELQNNRPDEFPFYFGNCTAQDFLQLENNEWSDGPMNQTELSRDYFVLSAGCGDLRNTVLTAASLPTRYQGKLYITLNDFDPFVMARNVFFLFMLVRFADTEGIESSLTTIWYSVHITKKEYDLIKTSLDELIQMTPHSLQEVTQGLVKVQDEDLRVMSQVWNKWRSLECQREKQSSINLRKQRKKELKIGKQLKKDMRLCYTNFSQSSSEYKQMEEWFDHGLFLPKDTKQITMSFDNPTLTGRAIMADVGELPEDSDFLYCISYDVQPFAVWDCLRVRESETRPCSSPMVMYHNYITKLLQRIKIVIRQGRLHIRISLANCMDFPSIHKSLKMPNYDRIFTSTLSDYIGFAKLLNNFKMLLNSSNHLSVIVTETSNWTDSLPEAICELGHREYKSCVTACCLDTGRELGNPMTIFDIGSHMSMDYFDNSPYFHAYLRAQIMAGGFGVPPLTKVPSFGEVMKYNGLQMRDFRRKLNRLVPFQYRVNARDLTMMRAVNRAVEWCLPHTDG